MFKTSYKYHSEKVEKGYDFDKQKTIFEYQREAYITVTASTQKECDSILESFQKYILDNDPCSYDCWDGCQDAELDEKTGKWIGDICIYFDCIEDKEHYKELYRAWKNTLKR